MFCFCFSILHTSRLPTTIKRIHIPCPPPIVSSPKPTHLGLYFFLYQKIPGFLPVSPGHTGSNQTCHPRATKILLQSHCFPMHDILSFSTIHDLHNMAHTWITHITTAQTYTYSHYKRCSVLKTFSLLVILFNSMNYSTFFFFNNSFTEISFAYDMIHPLT